MELKVYKAIKDQVQLQVLNDQFPERGFKPLKETSEKREGLNPNYWTEINMRFYQAVKEDFQNQQSKSILKLS